MPAATHSCWYPLNWWKVYGGRSLGYSLSLVLLQSPNYRQDFAGSGILIKLESFQSSVFYFFFRGNGEMMFGDSLVVLQGLRTPPVIHSKPGSAQEPDDTSSLGPTMPGIPSHPISVGVLHCCTQRCSGDCMVVPGIQPWLGTCYAGVLTTILSSNPSAGFSLRWCQTENKYSHIWQ